MKTLIVIGLIVLSACNSHTPVITREYIDELKKTATFQVSEYETHPFKDANEEDLVAALGLRGMKFFEDTKLEQGESVGDLPKNFVSQDKWPKCIHEIRDQQKCGSCWAFGASEVLSDRFCIASDSKVNLVLSPQDMVSCDTKDYGCQGGYLNVSWEYLEKTGIVDDACMPYTSGKGQRGDCYISQGKCADKTTTPIKYKAKGTRTFKTINDIKQDIFTNGPVETGFLVYNDFFSYKSGIYRKHSDQLAGGHAVKVVGWGYEDSSSTDYWVVANSWGAKWGEAGYFRIAMNNCCNFDTSMITGDADVQK
jgi:cathepsin B